MKKHILVQTNVETSRLGFGCVRLTAHHNRDAAMVNAGIFTAHMGTAARQTILGKLTLSHQAQYLAMIYRQTIA